MVLSSRTSFFFAVFFISNLFTNAFATNLIDFLICTSAENKSQYAVIQRSGVSEQRFDNNLDDAISLSNNLTPFFLANGYSAPDSCEKVNLENLTRQFPYLKSQINQYLTLESDKSDEEPLIVALPHYLNNSDTVIKVRPVIIATALTYAVLWAIGTPYAAPGTMLVFMNCAFAPERCQIVLENFSRFFSELWAKAQAAGSQVKPMSGTGARLGGSTTWKDD